MPRARKKDHQPWLKYILLPLLLIIFGLMVSFFLIPRTAHAPSQIPFIPTPTPTPLPASPLLNVSPSPTPSPTPKTKSNKYTCPNTSWIDCMPVIPPERKQMCNTAYLNWAQKNCPNFVGVSY